MSDDATAAIDPTAIGILQATPSIVRALFEAASEEAIASPDTAGWTPKDVLAHIIDVDSGVIGERLHRIVEDDHPFIRSIDPQARLSEGGFKERTLTSLLAELDEGRPLRIGWLQSLSSEQLARTGDHDQAGGISASDIAHQWAYHDLMHVSQIAAMLQATLVGRMGNTRKFYDV